MCNDFSQKCFWKNVSLIWNNCSKIWEISSGKKTLIWMDFKNSFVWLTGMKQLIFNFNNFFARVIFWSFFQIWWIKKMAGAKKFIKVKYQFFHACQPREEIFEIRSYWGLIFRAVFLNFKWPTLFHFCKFFAENWHSDYWGHIIS